MINSYKNVYIGSHGICYNKDGTIIPSTLDAYNDFNGSTAWPDENISFNPSRPVAQLPDHHYIHLLHPYNIHVWGHFREILTQLYFFQEEKFSDFKLLVNPSHFGEDNRDFHFKCFGYEHKVAKIQPSPRADLPYYKVSSLHQVKHDLSKYPSLLHLQYMRNKWFKELRLPPEKNLKKVYVSRVGSPTKRPIKNEREVINFLKSKGFYIFTGNETFRDQALLFRDAEMIIGAHGAAFFNVLFCNHNPRILEICPHNREVHMWRCQAETLGLDQYQVTTEPADNNFSFSIPLNLIKRFIR
tara:strand:- start:42614 stop:43510 length:897 start_codon:yes stop_codon:yes gene_type:complete